MCLLHAARAAPRPTDGQGPSTVLFAFIGGLFRGPTVQPDPAHLRAGRVPHVPAREGGGPAAGALPQDRWAPPRPVPSFLPCPAPSSRPAPPRSLAPPLLSLRPSSSSSLPSPAHPGPDLAWLSSPRSGRHDLVTSGLRHRFRKVRQWHPALFKSLLKGERAARLGGGDGHVTGILDPRGFGAGPPQWVWAGLPWALVGAVPGKANLEPLLAGSHLRKGRPLLGMRPPPGERSPSLPRHPQLGSALTTWAGRTTCAIWDGPSHDGYPPTHSLGQL